MSSAVPSADVGLDCVSGPDPGSEDAAMCRVFTRRLQKLMSDRNFELLRQSAAAREPRGVFASCLLPERAVLNENPGEHARERA